MSHSPHRKKTQLVITMATNRKRCASFYTAEPGHPGDSLFPPVWPLYSPTDKHPVGLLLKVDKRSSVYFSLWVLGLFFTTIWERCKWAQLSELCHISLHLAKPPLPKTAAQSPQFASHLHSNYKTPFVQLVLVRHSLLVPAPCHLLAV